MIEAYLDESGIHDGAAVCVIAGYFGGEGKWKKFEADWNGLLADFSIPAERFHAKNLFPERKGWFLDHWSGQHQSLLDGIGFTIAKHEKIHPVSAGIIVDDFNSLPLDERRYLTGATIRNGKPISSGSPNKPYFVPFQHVVIQVCDYASVGGKAQFFFGLDRNFFGYARDIFEQIKVSDVQSAESGPWAWKQRLGDPSFPLAKETPQLQIADFLSHLTYHHMLSAGERVGMVPPSPLLERCIQNRRSNEDFYFSNKQNLEAALRNAAALSTFLKESAAMSSRDHTSGVQGKVLSRRNDSGK
jgi:hypothetical protein